MNSRERNVLADLARLVDDLGPALVPATQLELLRSITDAAMHLFGAAACSLALLDEEAGELAFHVASGAGADAVVGMRMPAGQGVAGWVVMSGQPIAIENVQTDPRFSRTMAESTGYVPRSILAMPLETERRTVGVISVLDRQTEGAAATRDMELLDLFARQAALAIENSQVFSELGRALFGGLSALVDDRDLSDALIEAAATSSGPQAELRELAGAFLELGRSGPAERAAAVRLLGDFAAYVRARSRRR